MRTLLSFIVGFLLFGRTVQAQEAEVRVETSFQPISAVGLVIGAGGARQELETKLESAWDGSSRVSFPIPAEEASEGGVATAVVVSEQGEIAFGNTISLSPEGAKNAFSGVEICEEHYQPTPAIISQYALLESLVEVRGERRKLEQLKMKKNLDEDLLKKLRKLEASFGLSYPKELSAELNPVELIERFSRLINTIQTYKAFRKAPQSEDDSAEQEEK